MTLELVEVDLAEAKRSDLAAALHFFE